MDAWKDGVKEDAAAEATVEAGAGDLSGLGPARHAGVDFGGVGSRELGGGDLRLNDLFGAAGDDHDHAIDAPGPAGGLGHAVDARVNDLGSDNSPPLLGAERASGADPARVSAPAGRGAGLRGRDGVVGRDMTGDLRPAGGDLGGPMRHAALLAMLVGATTLIGEPDAPRPNKLGALLIWLAGCVTLFLSRN